MSSDQQMRDAVKDMPVFGRVEAIYKSTTALCEAGRSIANVLVTINNKTDFEEATAAIYLRMFFWIDSLTRLNKVTDVQAACSAARSMYELLIDLLDLRKEPNLVEQFTDFNFVERFRAAKVLVEAMDEHGDTIQHKPQRKFFEDPANKQKFDSLLAKHFDGKIPKSWKCKDLAKRAKDLGPAEQIRYRNIYPTLSWYSHAGIVGFYGLSEDAYLSGFGFAQLYAQQVFQEASLLIGEQFQIFTVPELKQRIIDYSNATMQAIAEQIANEQKASHHEEESAQT